MTLMKILAPVSVLGMVMTTTCYAQEQTTTSVETSEVTVEAAPAVADAPLTTIANGKRLKTIRKRYIGPGQAVASTADRTLASATATTQAKSARRAERGAKHAINGEAQAKVLAKAAEQGTPEELEPKGHIAIAPGHGQKQSLKIARVADTWLVDAEPQK